MLIIIYLFGGQGSQVMIGAHILLILILSRLCERFSVIVLRATYTGIHHGHHPQQCVSGQRKGLQYFHGKLGCCVCKASAFITQTIFMAYVFWILAIVVSVTLYLIVVLICISLMTLMALKYMLFVSFQGSWYLIWCQRSNLVDLIQRKHLSEKKKLFNVIIELFVQLQKKIILEKLRLNNKYFLSF